MKTNTLPAHFDGKKIRLDKPFNLKPNTKLRVTVLPKEDIEDEKIAWLRLSGEKLEYAFGNDEPDYSNSIIKEKNPDYEGR
jgi:hypothetical protein